MPPQPAQGRGHGRRALLIATSKGGCQIGGPRTTKSVFKAQTGKSVEKSGPEKNGGHCRHGDDIGQCPTSPPQLRALWAVTHEEAIYTNSQRACSEYIFGSPGTEGRSPGRGDARWVPPQPALGVADRNVEGWMPDLGGQKQRSRRLKFKQANR